MDRCDFKNEWMSAECGMQVFNDGGDPFCIHHGTRQFLAHASDYIVDEDLDDRPAKSGDGWSSSDVAILIQMVNDRISFNEIGIALERTANAVYNKLWSLAKGKQNE